MNADIRLAGVDERSRIRLKMAADLLQAYQIRAKLTDWDGTRCHCVITIENDAYGDHVGRVARRQNVPQLKLSENGTSFDASTNTIGKGASLNLFVDTLLSLLKSKTKTAELFDMGSSGLVMMANEAYQQEKDLIAHVDGVEILILKSSGQVAAKGEGDILVARDKLCSGGWRFEECRTMAGDDYYLESLDTFLVRGAFQNADKLPPYPDGLYRLKYWPDLGNATDLVDALRISNLLQKRAISNIAISKQCQIDASLVSALLWSFKASSLLISDSPTGGNQVTSRPGKRVPAQNLFRKLAARFGLTREN